MQKLADALLIIDLQKGVCFGEEEIFNLASIIELVNQRILDYSENGKMIIFVQHNDEVLLQGKEAWEILDELNQEKADYLIQKTHANSFYQTNLKNFIETNAIHSLEICGAQTEFCLDTTVKFAHGLGYELQMLQGATTTFDNAFMSAEKTRAFYETIWDQRFLTLIK
ncbi:cysteine hydrolase family protein [Enterococcus sp. LJL99]